MRSYDGSVAEWSIAPVLKTGNGKPFVSSNLTASAKCVAPMAKLVDARDLKSLAARRAGSIPAGCTNNKIKHLDKSGL